MLQCASVTVQHGAVRAVMLVRRSAEPPVLLLAGTVYNCLALLCPRYLYIPDSGMSDTSMSDTLRSDSIVSDTVMTASYGKPST